jgi:hypothetical protein
VDFILYSYSSIYQYSLFNQDLFKVNLLLFEKKAFLLIHTVLFFVPFIDWFPYLILIIHILNDDCYSLLIGDIILLDILGNILALNMIIV